MEEKVIRKWFWAWEADKEELWLNSMAAAGWRLCRIGFCTYHFTPCQPGEYIIRLEMHAPDAAYLSFMEELGAEYIGRMVQWVYFCRRAEEGPFDLFSDIDSKLAHLGRISKALAGVGAANLLIGLANTFATSLGWLNLLCATLIMYGLGRIHGQMESLKKDRLLRE